MNWPHSKRQKNIQQPNPKQFVGENYSYQSTMCVKFQLSSPNSFRYMRRSQIWYDTTWELNPLKTWYTVKEGSGWHRIAIPYRTSYPRAARVGDGQLLDDFQPGIQQRISGSGSNLPIRKSVALEDEVTSFTDRAASNQHEQSEVDMISRTPNISRVV